MWCELPNLAFFGGGRRKGRAAERANLPDWAGELRGPTDARLLPLLTSAFPMSSVTSPGPRTEPRSLPGMEHRPETGPGPVLPRRGGLHCATRARRMRVRLHGQVDIISLMRRNGTSSDPDYSASKKPEFGSQDEDAPRRDLGTEWCGKGSTSFCLGNDSLHRSPPSLTGTRSADRGDRGQGAQAFGADAKCAVLYGYNPLEQRWFR